MFGILPWNHVNMIVFVVDVFNNYNYENVRFVKLIYKMPLYIMMNDIVHFNKYNIRNIPTFISIIIIFYLIILKLPFENYYKFYYLHILFIT